MTEPKREQLASLVHDWLVTAEDLLPGRWLDIACGWEVENKFYPFLPARAVQPSIFSLVTVFLDL